MTKESEKNNQKIPTINESSYMHSLNAISERTGIKITTLRKRIQRFEKRGKTYLDEDDDNTETMYHPWYEKRYFLNRSGMMVRYFYDFEVDELTAEKDIRKRTGKENARKATEARKRQAREKKEIKIL